MLITETISISSPFLLPLQFLFRCLLQNPKTPSQANPLKALNMGANRLKEECKRAASVKPNSGNDSSQKIITCAYDIAKAAKQLVSIFK